MKSIALLLSDGCSNCGGDPEGVATALKTKADVIAIAFGADADLPRLERLATTPAHALRCANGGELRRFFATVGATMSRSLQGGGDAAALLGNGVLRG